MMPRRTRTPKPWIPLLMALGAVAAWPSVMRAQEVRVELIGARVEHRMSAGTSVDRAAGFAFGAGIWAPLMGWMEIQGQLTGGALAARTPETDDRRFGELDLSLFAIPFDWLAFEVGGGSRAYTGSLGRQRWVTMRVGGEVRLAFGDGRVRGTLGGALMPVVTVSGVESPSVAVAGNAGIVYRHRDLSAALVYEIERYDFPAEGGTRRLEQMSSVGARIGVRAPKVSWPW